MKKTMIYLFWKILQQKLWKKSLVFEGKLLLQSDALKINVLHCGAYLAFCCVSKKISIFDIHLI